MILRPHKADHFVVNEPEYAAVLDTHFAVYRRHLITVAETKGVEYVKPVWLDIGAHIGSAAIKIARRGASMIYCFEPEPFNFAILTKNVQAYDYIVPMNHAVVGATQDKQPILWANTGTNTGRHSLSGGLARTHKVQGFEVNALRFSYLMSMTNAKCAKIDIEGAEHMFFDELIESELEFVMMEYHCDKAAQDGFIDYMHVETAEHLAKEAGWDFHIIAENAEYKTYIIVMTRYKSTNS